MSVTTNVSDWNLLYTIFQNYEAYSYTKPYRKACDGRGAYFALRQSYLGVNNVDKLANDHETHFEALEYTLTRHVVGTSRSMSTSMLSFIISRRTSNAMVIPAGINESSRVRKLVKGIKTNKLDSAKTRIMTLSEISSANHQLQRFHNGHTDNSRSAQPVVSTRSFGVRLPNMS
jgi:hypothetical protein